MQQKVGSQLARLDQGHRPLCEDGDHHPRKASAGTNVQPRRVGPWRKANELGAVGNMARPEVGDGVGPGQILSHIFVEQQRDIPFQLLICFTWNASTSRGSDLIDHAALRTRAKCSADSAAGVTPAMREAWSRSAGPAASNRSRISFD